MPVHEIAAVGAATCWALTALFSSGPAGHLGSLIFNRTRQITVSGLLLVYVLATGHWRDIQPAMLGPLLLSGFVGIFIGDTMLFTCLNRLGPRRSGILYALNAPIAALLGWAILGERLSATAAAGVALTIGGVVLAILFGNRRTPQHQLETVKGALWVGVLVGLLAALSQAVGSLIARPVMAAGLDPMTASMVRVTTAMIGLSILTQLPIEAVRARGPITATIFFQTALLGIIGLGVGMTLIMFALSGGQVGIVSTLSATTPVIILPLLWLKTKVPPAPGAWAGAALVVLGMALIFWR